MASKNTETVLLEVEKDSKSDNLESEKETLGRESIQNGSATEICLPGNQSSKKKPKPPVPPKRSTLTYGKNYSSVSATSPCNSNAATSTNGTPSPLLSKETDHPLTSHLVSVKTNILAAPKVLLVPKNKNQPVLSTFLPALPPKSSKSSLASSPNLPKNQNFDTQSISSANDSSQSECVQEKTLDEERKNHSVAVTEQEKRQEQDQDQDLELERQKEQDRESEPKSSPAETLSLKSPSSKTSPEFSPSQSPPPLPQPPAKPVRKSASTPPKGEQSDRESDIDAKNVESESNDRFKEAPSDKVTAQQIEISVERKERSHSVTETSLLEPFYSADGSEKTNTIKRAPPSHFDQKARSDFGTKIRTKSPIRVSFADDDKSISRKDEKLSKTKRATKELKNIIHQIEYSESDYCSDDNCRTCTIRKTSSLSRRRSVSPKSSISKALESIEGYTSCCEEGTKIVPKKPKNILKNKIPEKNVQTVFTRSLCNCPYDNFVIDNRVPLSRPNSSIGDYGAQSSRARSSVIAKKNSGSGIKTPFWNGSARYDISSPGLGLIVTISSDGIDKEPKRTVQFISGGPALNFGLGGTLGRYTKSKSQDKSLKIASNGFHSDRSASDFEGITEKLSLPSTNSDLRKERPDILEKAEENKNVFGRSTPIQRSLKNTSEKDRRLGELIRSRSSSRNENYRTIQPESLNGTKSPGEVLEHFGKLATSVTTSEISKLSNGITEPTRETSISVKNAIKNLEKNSSSNKSQNHSFENYRTVPPASFNNPDPYLGSAFVQYVRETLPHQPNSLPGNSTESPFDKYLRHGSGRFDKSLILPQQPKSDKPSAFERLCGDKIYSSRRGIYGKRSSQNQNVSGSLDCVWGKPKQTDVAKKDSEDPLRTEDTRPSSCTFEITKSRRSYKNPLTGSTTHPNYAIVNPILEKEKSSVAIPRTSKKGIIETETSTNQLTAPSIQTVNFRACSPQTIRANSPQYFNPRSLENYKLAPGFKTDLSTLYSGVFYMNNNQDGSSSKSTNNFQLLNEYGIRCNVLGTLNRNTLESTCDNTNQSSDSMGTSNSTGRGSGEEPPTGRKILTGGLSSMAAACRIPEEAPPGLLVTFPPQYHPSEDELLREDKVISSLITTMGISITL